MIPTLATLVTTALSLGFIHTLLGPDHYVPFLALAKSNSWSYRKTMLISFSCGIAHCLSSVIIGLIGIVAGLAVAGLVHVEEFRGNIASWLMLAFGVTYLAWAIKNKARKKHSHSELEHLDGSNKNRNLFWAIFIIFIFGPCEPLIPLLMVPAAHHSLFDVTLVASAFTLATVGTMLSIVSLAYFGFRPLRLNRLAPFSEILTGAALTVCGVALVVGF